MIELLELSRDMSADIRQEIENKINELIAGYNELHKKLDPLAANINNKTGEVTWRLYP